MKHYVYRITNIKLNKHYYGTRTAKKNKPEKDIGYIYFSSSSDKNFIKDQKENSQDYNYKIIKKFRTRKEAIELEIKLHNKFNVGINESFYNKSIQSSKNFDTSGRTLSEEHKKNISEGLKKAGRTLSEEHKKILRKCNLGKKHSEESIIKMSESSKNILHSKETKSKMSESKKGDKNANAKVIYIYDKNNNIKYKTKGNFKKICIANNLPESALRGSSRDNGRKIFTKRLTQSEFSGWYAKVI